MAAHGDNLTASLQRQVDDLEHRLRQLRETRRSSEGIDVMAQVAKMYGVQEQTDISIRRVRALHGHYGKVYSVAWARNSRQLCTAAQDGKLIIWNAYENAKNLVISLRQSWVMACAYSPGGSMVASGGLDNFITIHRLPDGLNALAGKGKSKQSAGGLGQAHITAELMGHQGYISSCSFVDGDRTLFSTSGDGVCALFDIEKQCLMHEFIGHESDVVGHCTDATDSNIFLTCSVDKSVRLWDARAGSAPQGVFLGHDGDVNAVSFLPNCTSFVTASDDCSARLFDIRAYSQIGVYSESSILASLTSVAVSRSGRYIFTGTEKCAICIWDTQLCQPTRVIPNAHDNRVCSVAMSPDGTALASISFDFTVGVWA